MFHLNIGSLASVTLILAGCDQAPGADHASDSSTSANPEAIAAPEKAHDVDGSGPIPDEPHDDVPPGDEPDGLRVQSDPQAAFSCTWASSVISLTGSGTKSASWACDPSAIYTVTGGGCSLESGADSSMRIVDMRLLGDTQTCKYYKTTASTYDVTVWCNRCT